MARALVPLTEGELSDRLSGPGTLSLSARVPRDELGFSHGEHGSLDDGEEGVCLYIVQGLHLYRRPLFKFISSYRPRFGRWFDRRHWVHSSRLLQNVNLKSWFARFGDVFDFRTTLFNGFQLLRRARQRERLTDRQRELEMCFYLRVYIHISTYTYTCVPMCTLYECASLCFFPSLSCIYLCTYACVSLSLHMCKQRLPL